MSSTNHIDYHIVNPLVPNWQHVVCLPQFWHWHCCRDGQEVTGEKERVPQMARVRDGPVAGDPLALPLVESVQFIGVIAHAPLFGIQIPPLIKLVPQVIPVSIQDL